MNPRKLLLVEDNEADIFLVDESLKAVDQSMRPQLIALNDGEKAIQYISNSNEIQPDLILLDINLPKHSGIEVLQFIRKESSIKNIPIIMMSTSQTKSDISKCFDNGCNSYIIKPIDFNDFSHVIQCLCNYWFKTSVLPTFEK